MAEPIPLYPDEAPVESGFSAYSKEELQPSPLRYYPRRIRGKSPQEAAEVLREGGFLVVPSTPGDVKAPDHYNPDRSKKYSEEDGCNTRNLFDAPVRPGGGLGVANTGCRDHDVPKAFKNIEPHLRKAPLHDVYKKEKRWMDVPHPPLMVDFTGGGGTQIRAKPVQRWAGISGKTMPGSVGEVFSGVDDPSKQHYGFQLTEPTKMGAGDKQYKKDRKYTPEGYISLYNVDNPRERIISLYGLVPPALEASVALAEANINNDDPDWCIELPDWPEETVREICVLYGIEDKKSAKRRIDSITGTAITERAFTEGSALSLDDKRHTIERLWSLRCEKENGDESTYETWINTGLNIYKDDDGEDGFKLWDHYSKLDVNNYDPDEVSDKWDSFQVTVGKHLREDEEKRATGKHVGISGWRAILAEILKLSGKPASYYDHCDLIMENRLAKILNGTRVELFDKRFGLKVSQFDVVNINSIWEAMENDTNPDVVKHLWAVSGRTTKYVEREVRLKRLMRDHSTREYQGLYIHIEGVGPEALTRQQLEEKNPEAYHHFVPLLRKGVTPKINREQLKDIEKWIYQGFLISGNDPVSYEYIIGAMSVKVKLPNTRINTMPIVKGEQGCGKSSHCEAFMMALGYDEITSSSDTAPIAVSLQKKEVTGDFNKRLQTSVVGLINELAIFTKSEEVDSLKALLTSPMLSIELKGVDIYSVENKLWIVATTNQDVPILIDLQDRRFVYMDSIQLSKYRPAHCPDNESYWRNEVAIPMNDPAFQGALIAYLALRQPVEGINLMSSPDTEAKKKVVDLSADKPTTDNVRNYIKWLVSRIKGNHPELVDWLLTPASKRPDQPPSLPCYLTTNAGRIILDGIPNLEIGGSIANVLRSSAENLFDDYVAWKNSGDDRNRNKTINMVDVSHDKVTLPNALAKSINAISFNGVRLVSRQGRLKCRHDTLGNRGQYELDITEPLLDICSRTERDNVTVPDGYDPLAEARALARKEVARWKAHLPEEIKIALEGGQDVSL